MFHIPIAYAAQQVPGTVPILEPLQPAPVGVKPDISHNSNNVTNPAVLPEGVTVQQGQNGETQVITAPDRSGVFVSSGPRAATQWVIVLAVIIAVAIGLLVVRRYWPAKRKTGGGETE